LKFSTRTLYGLKAILVLAMRYGEGSLSVSQIAKKEGISVAYLEQILNALKKKGLVKSVRGPQGGYVLAQKPSEVTLEDLFYCMEKKLFVEKDSSAAFLKDRSEISIGNALFWQKFNAGIQKSLSETTLKELVDEARHIKKSKISLPMVTFHI